MYSNPYEHLSGTIKSSKLKKAGFQEFQFDTGEIKFNYVVGPDNGPPLVLIPAQMGMWESYQKVLVPLSNDFQVFALDIRGAWEIQLDAWGIFLAHYWRGHGSFF
nr:alpha/beta hydrolase [Planococcus glaciei]